MFIERELREFLHAFHSLHAQKEVCSIFLRKSDESHSEINRLCFRITDFDFVMI